MRKSFFADDSGKVSAVAYRLMFTLVAVSIITAISMLGTTLSGFFQKSANQFITAGG